MGDLILLDHIRLRSRASGNGAGHAAAVANGSSARADSLHGAPVPGFGAPIREFYFDLACPFSYLAAERVERLLGQVEWLPVSREALGADPLPSDQEFFAAQGRAHELRLPLNWPEWSEKGFPTARRVAAFASESGAGGRFALAGLRLAFCGGYDLEAAEILAEASAAAGLAFDACLAASVDEVWDEVVRIAGRRVAGAGVKRLPAFRIGERWFEGEQGLLEAVASLRHGLGAGARVPA